MHDEKIWGLDVSDRYLLTGGGDSTLKLWLDCSAEKEIEDREKMLLRLQDEHKLSTLIRAEDYIEAALMAFRLNKLRDFYLVLNKILSNKTNKVDPVDAVIQDRLKFKAFIESVSNVSDSRKAVDNVIDNSEILSKIVTRLLKEDNKKRLIEIIRNLNSKHDYAHIAHALLSELLPRFHADEYLETPEYRGANQGELKESLKIMSFYS